MIYHLRGTLIELLPQQIILDVAGVGYLIHCPTGAFDLQHQLGSELTVLIHHHQTEAAQTLYGFAHADQRNLFRLMIERVSGVGPKVALSVLSGLSTEEFRRCVIEKDAKSLAQVKGLGIKTAERILLELNDKVQLDQAWQPSNTAQPSSADFIHTTILALLALGYKQTNAKKAAQQAYEAHPKSSESELLRHALALLR